MGKLLCEKNLRDVWCRNESVRAEIGQILHTDTRVNLSSSDIYIYIQKQPVIKSALHLALAVYITFIAFLHYNIICNIFLQLFKYKHNIYYLFMYVFLI